MDRTASSLAGLFLFFSFGAVSAADEPYWIHSFERIDLSDVFLCEGATYGDVSGDGKADIISGPYWYEGPDFKKRHEIYPPKTFDIKRYSDNFFAYLYDFTRDGALDILFIGFPGKEAYWFENPRGKPGHWKRNVVFDSVCNESPTFADLTGDGKPDLVCIDAGRYGYAEFDPAAPEKKWPFTPISEDRKLSHFTHGMGIGDVNGDGRMDLLEKHGWYEQPGSLADRPLWKYHAHPFALGVGGAQMYAYDFDGDGDNDVLTSQNAHGFGLVWHENVPKDGAISFTERRIMGKEPSENPYGVAVPQLHAIDLIDMDGDGLKDIVTGKRIWAHYGEPSAEKPAEAWWFKLVRKARKDGKGGEPDFLPFLMDAASGVGTQVVAGDVNADGLPDVVAGNKLGSFILIHKRKAATKEEWKSAQPRRTDAAGLTPEEAAEAMTVPEGFKVELVAGEPNLHQPVALAIDERSRLWVAEAHTYPNRVKGREGKWNEGRDKIVILDDADGDGRWETRKVFAENLNLVSGLEVGFGGVWVGAAPFLLFFPDKDRDDRPDGDPEVLLDGWGFQDTHETLNSFIWGPDGWLYGCHGVFTHSRVGRPGTPDAERIGVNAAVWRFHPTRRQFEVFAWGTSNPWGVDFDDRGQAFITACVIPHLYHMVQGGRYQRQGGRHFDEYVYDDLKTIGDHLHYTGNIGDHAWWGHEPLASTPVLAAGGGHAHCGAMLYLGDSFPERYRNTVFMNNIHGNRVNNDVFERRGSGFVGKHGRDFLIANDRWFRGINLKYGPDGGVYLIDWYDKNACHRTNPEIWDRTSGRLYKISYGETKRQRPDLSKLSDEALVELTLHKNDWWVRQARRLLQERGPKESVHKALAAMLSSQPAEDRKLRALWALHATAGLHDALALEQLSSPHEYVRAWTVQLLSEREFVSRGTLKRFVDLSRSDPSPVVRLYLASALQRLSARDRWAIAEGLVARAEDAADHNIPLLIWYGIEPVVGMEPARGLELARSSRIDLVTRFIARRAASVVENLEPAMDAILKAADPASRALLVEEMEKAFEGRLNISMPAGWKAVYEKLESSSDAATRDRAQAIAVKFGDRRVFPRLRAVLGDSKAELKDRRRALEILLDGKDPEAPAVLQSVLSDAAIRARALQALGGFDDPATPAAILKAYGGLTAAEKADAIATLSSRPGYAKALMGGVQAGVVARTDLNAVTMRQLRGLKDADLDALIEKSWGTVRESSDDKKELVRIHKERLTERVLKDADARNGRAAFARACQQCHTLFGAGSKIGPDLTGSNRANLDYVLENILDPNAVVGKDYQMTVVRAKGGRLVVGLILKETESAVTLRTVNEEVVVAKKEIIESSLSDLSLMPEDLFGQLKPEEVRDLVAYLASPAQVLLPGVPVEIDATMRRVPGALEAERLKVVKKTGGDLKTQDMVPFGRGLWTGNEHLFWTGAKPGDKLELSVPVERDGTYELDLALTQAPDYAIVQLYLDGQKIEGPVDLYHPKVVPTGTASLGEYPLSKGEHILGVEILGANPAARKNHFIGLDYVLLTEKKAEAGAAGGK